MITLPQTEMPLTIEYLITHIKDLPTLPQVALELLSDLDNDDSSLDFINEKIAMDQSLTAKVLRLANSSHFGANSRVLTIQQATTLLGIKHIKNVIRMSLLTNSLPPPECEGFDFVAFWRHSIATATCAELISRALHMKHDFAFTAGLLHDIGRLVLATYCPLDYAQTLRYRDEHDCTLLTAEHAIMQTDHVEIGLALAKHWKFAEALQEAISGHHRPDAAGVHSLAAIVHVANAIVHALDLDEEENELAPLLSGHAWDTLSLSDTDYLHIFRETEMRFQALNQIFI